MDLSGSGEFLHGVFEKGNKKSVSKPAMSGILVLCCLVTGKLQ